MSAVPSFTDTLIAWQKRAGRHDLPWQNTRDPYRIWLSEIMLQQTQVTTVIPYYLRFLERFPTLEALAAAPQEAVIEYWAGLGYYARARNLHRCAVEIVAVHAGKWPKSVDRLASLPGIGRSTAAAIAAFAFGERAAILDGNVKRVLCRFFAIEGFPGQASVERALWARAETLLPECDIEAYTQGLMDLGATLCSRRKPHCNDCPLQQACQAHRTGRAEDLPTAKPRPALPERHGHYVFVSDGHRVLLERRPAHGIWGGLLVPPEGETAAVLARLGISDASESPLGTLRHSFTHFRLTLSATLCHIDAPKAIADPSLCWIALESAAEAGVPTPIRKLLEGIAPAREAQ